jgi:predicted transcriptional regulator
MSTLVSLRTEEALIEKLDEIATEIDRTRNWVINDAIKQYLETCAWRLEHIQQGIADSDAGRTITLDQLKRRIEKRHKARLKAAR